MMGLKLISHEHRIPMIIKALILTRTLKINANI